MTTTLDTNTLLNQAQAHSDSYIDDPLNVYYTIIARAARNEAKVGDDKRLGSCMHSLNLSFDQVTEDIEGLKQIQDAHEQVNEIEQRMGDLRPVSEITTEIEQENRRIAEAHRQLTERKRMLEMQAANRKRFEDELAQRRHGVSSLRQKYPRAAEASYAHIGGG